MPANLGPRHEPTAAAFTLVDLLCVVAALALLMATLPVALAKPKPSTRGVQCLNNLRQTAGAWAMYSADHHDRVANNSGFSGTLQTINAGQFDTWANNVLTWGASSSVSDQSNTNLLWLAKGGLGPYLPGKLNVLSCPSDTYLSPAQQAMGWTRRTRSIAMNSVFGRFNPSSTMDPTAHGINWAISGYRQYLKQADVSKPFKTWLFIEDHPDSINDGYFANNPTASNWQDIPAAFHYGGSSFAFADLHCEMKQWLSPTSRLKVGFFYNPVPFDETGRTDYAWYLERTGWVRITGQPAFGY